MSTLNYSVPGKLIDKIAIRKRLEMYQLFMDKLQPGIHDKILDVGVTTDQDAQASNYFEKCYPHKENIIALSNQDANFLAQLYPGLNYQFGDARALPFPANYIDYVISSAVIEHVGSLTHQQQMLSECFRVARKGIFITTPNRWHPIDAHTLLPLIHWLPKKLHRQLLKLCGLEFYAKEENLNLLDKHSLVGFCHTIGITKFEIFGLKTLGFTSNLILIAYKA